MKICQIVLINYKGILDNNGKQPYMKWYYLKRDCLATFLAPRYFFVSRILLIYLSQYLELKGDIVSAKVGVEPGGNVDGGRLAGGILHHEEQLRHDLDDVAGLEDKVALALDGLGGQAAGDVRLAAKLSRRGGLNIHKTRR